MKQYRYGIVLISNDKEAITNLEAQDGLYVAIEFFSDNEELQDSFYFGSIGRWLNAARPALIKKLKAQRKSDD